MTSDNPKIEYMPNRQHRISFACLVLCGVMIAVLGVLVKLPSFLIQLLRPSFIFFGFFAIKKGFYSLGAVKWQIISIVYYTFILLFNPITSSVLTTYFSIVIFGIFFVCAVSITWNKGEIVLLLVSVVFACDIQSTGVLFSNPHLLTAGGNQHIDFLGSVLNRNPVAFAITPGVLSSLLILLNSKKGKLMRLFSMASFLLCSFLVFALGCRSAFLSAAGGSLLIMWQKTKEGNSAQERANRKVLLVILVLIVFFAAMNLASGNYSERLFDLNSDSGRQAIWDEAWALIDTKPIFGGGFDYWAATGHEMGTHNTFLTFMVSTGWVGGVLLGMLFIAVGVEILKSKNLIPMAFFVETLAHSWSEPGLDYYAYIPLIIALIITRYIQHQRKDICGLFI